MKSIVLFVVLAVLSLNINAQDNDGYTYDGNTSKVAFKDKLFTGGNFGFNISNGLMYLELAPILGYKVSDNFSTGISGKYLYWGPTNSNSPFLSYKYYGGGLFGRYRISPSILASAEYELLNVQDLNPNSGSYGERTFSNVFLLGAGYSNEIANNLNVQLFLLYDVIDDPNSPYRYNYIFGPNGVPVIYRIGFSLGF
ncbi:MAG: hypothetical protein N4A35_00460 [Flavobacteriales bacterium]|jgi:hypothetical protein|nr:hypothetical protein [Flavobacteriales bacterium]